MRRVLFAGNKGGNLRIHSACQQTCIHDQQLAGKLAASEARNAAAPTNSSSLPKRFIGVRKRYSLPRSVPSRSAELRAVRNTPGAIALTQTPWLTHSMASDLVKDATAALLAE